MLHNNWLVSVFCYNFSPFLVMNLIIFAAELKKKNTKSKMPSIKTIFGRPKYSACIPFKKKSLMFLSVNLICIFHIYSLFKLRRQENRRKFGMLDWNPQARIQILFFSSVLSLKGDLSFIETLGVSVFFFS